MGMSEPKIRFCMVFDGRQRALAAPSCNGRRARGVLADRGRACDTWEVRVTESREESRRHYLRHAACSPLPPAQSVLCVRDGRCAAGPEAQLEFEPGGRSRWAEPRRSRPLGPHRKRTFGLTALTVHCHRAHRAGSPLGSFRRDTHTAAAGRALTCLSPRAGWPSGLGDFAALRGALRLSLPLGSPLGLTAGLFSKGCLCATCRTAHRSVPGSRHQVCHVTRENATWCSCVLAHQWRIVNRKSV